VSRLRLAQLDSHAALRCAAEDWDDLWRRSEATLPGLRAELLAQWLEHFAPGKAFRALVVADAQRWLAALPLVSRRVGGWLWAGGLPINDWANAGDMLLDPAAPAEEVLELLVSALGQLPWRLLWLDEVPSQSVRWSAFRQILARHALPTHLRPCFVVARIHVGGDWESYRRSWSRKHRQKMSWAQRRLATSGELCHRVLRNLPPEAVETWLRRGFELEDAGWKRNRGASVLRTPGMFGFFLRQAQQLAAWQQLELHFLDWNARPIAFACGQVAKGAYHSWKTAYEPDYRAYSPGQLLRYFMLREFFSSGRYQAMDCLGPLTPAHAAWRPDAYAVARLAVGIGPCGKALLTAYRVWKLLVPSPTSPAHAAAETHPCPTQIGAEA
jgi:CelD/BcsL family acetyltransferase involved in cellulose biosynthesis